MIIIDTHRITLAVKIKKAAEPIIIIIVKIKNAVNNVLAVKTHSLNALLILLP